MTAMAHGESSTASHQNEQVPSQKLEHRTGHVYKHTPVIGSLSPSQATHDRPGDQDSDSEPEIVISSITRRSTQSKSYSDTEEENVVKRLDRCLVHFLAFLYLLSFLDRSNIGNARVAGLETSLSMSAGQFDLCLLAFYITYITFQWMILLYRVVPAHMYIAGCVLAWGFVASLQSLVTSFGQLLVLRTGLGATEAAFSPGLPFYLTFFYKRSELAYRVGLQISTAPLATSIAGGLAWIITQAAQYIGLEQWRALFLIEGFPSVIAAIVAWYWIPDSPSTAPWLKPRERKIAMLRLQPESSASSAIAPRPGDKGNQSRSKLDLSELRRTLLDPKAYLTALMFLSVNVSFASLPVFLPTVINSMSFPPLTSQILSAPPYLVAFIFVLIMGHYSDKKADSRSLFICGAATLSCLSYTIIALAGRFHDTLGDRMSIAARYFAIYPAAMGLFSSVVLIITWTLNNQQSATGKGMGMVILNIVGQCGPFIGVKLFPRASGPLYVSGMAVCAGFMAGVATLALVLRRYLAWLNDKNSDLGRGSYEMVALADENPNEDGEDVEEAEDGTGPGQTLRNEGQFRYML